MASGPLSIFDAYDGRPSHHGHFFAFHYYYYFIIIITFLIKRELLHQVACLLILI